jgi:aminoglycoside phosphotransferase (APT) family kinase protein
MPDEQVLKGGLIDSVVRVGDTVRRTAGPWTPTIHALLRHLKAKGFPAPVPLGIDEQGREIVSFLEGDAALRPWPTVMLREEGVVQCARLLRAYHDAVADFVPPSPAIWRSGTRTLSAGEIVCHGDFGPYNLIWQGDALTGVIDWDLAHPAPAVHDVAFAAWQIAPLRPDDLAAEMGLTPPFPRATRLRAFARAYGFDGGLQVLVGAVLDVLGGSIAEMETLGAKGIAPWTEFLRHGLRERTMRERAWLVENAGRLSKD